MEQAIAAQIARHLTTAADGHRIQAVVDARTAGPLRERTLDWAAAVRRESRTMVRDLLKCGVIGAGRLHLTLDASTLATKLLVEVDALDPQVLTLSFPFALRRRGIETKLIVGEPLPEPDLTLVRALADAHAEMAARRAGRGRGPDAETSAASGSRRRRRSYLAFLSPRIQQAIAAGRVPEGLSLERLLRTDLPLDWREQETRLGFDALFG